MIKNKELIYISIMEYQRQIVIIFVLILCIILAYRTNGTVLSLILGAIFVYKNYNSDIIKNINNLFSLETFADEIKIVEKEIEKNKPKNDYLSIKQPMKKSEPFVISFQENKKENLTEPNDKSDILIPTISKSHMYKNCDITIDGDECMAYQNIHRNEPTRVIKGSMDKYKTLSKYLKEESEEVEGKEWWGNMDY